jgi:hypothetical protein
MKNKKIIFLSLFIVLLFSLTACLAKESTDVKKDIIGKWATSDNSATLEFTADNQVHYTMKNGGVNMTVNGNLAWISDNVTLAVWEPQMQPCEVHIWGDKMELKPDNGDTLTVYRVK